MTEGTDIYGESSFAGGEPVAMPKAEQVEDKKVPFPLRIHFTGGSVDILSPLPKEKFLIDLIAEIQAKGNDPQWIGWFGFRKFVQRTRRTRSIEPFRLWSDR